jgi:hypothetical protein
MEGQKASLQLEGPIRAEAAKDSRATIRNRHAGALLR